MSKPPTQAASEAAKEIFQSKALSLLEITEIIDRAIDKETYRHWLAWNRRNAALSLQNTSQQETEEIADWTYEPFMGGKNNWWRIKEGDCTIGEVKGEGQAIQICEGHQRLIRQIKRLLKTYGWKDGEEWQQKHFGKTSTAQSRRTCRISCEGTGPQD